MTKVSVITISKNGENVIEKTIQSVLEQTYSPLEFIVIDGESIDGTKKIIEKYQKDISVYISEPDGGIYDAMNKGIRLATGEIVIFLNCGDYFISKDVINFSISKMDLSRVDLFFARIIWNDPKTNDIVLSNHNWVRYTWDLKKSNFPHPATFYKRNLFGKVGFFDTSYSIVADYEWNLRALILHKICFQCLNLATTVFFADGISNKESFADKRIAETNTIYSLYFKPEWLYRHNFKNNDRFLFNRYLKKILARIYDGRLNRAF